MESFRSIKQGAVRKVCRCEPVTDVTGVVFILVGIEYASENRGKDTSP